MLAGAWCKLPLQITTCACTTAFAGCKATPNLPTIGRCSPGGNPTLDPPETWVLQQQRLLVHHVGEQNSRRAPHIPQGRAVGLPTPAHEEATLLIASGAFEQASITAAAAACKQLAQQAAVSTWVQCIGYGGAAAEQEQAAPTWSGEREKVRDVALPPPLPLLMSSACKQDCNMARVAEAD